MSARQSADTRHGGRYTIAFMPWADLRDRTEIGDVAFCPLPAFLDELADVKVREHLARYFACYVDYEGNAADSVTVCAHSHARLGPLSEKETLDLRSAVDALVFTVIAPAMRQCVLMNNRSVAPPSADRYDLVMYPFALGDPGIAVRAGSVTHAGYEIGQVVFQKPWSVGGGIFGQPDGKMVDALAEVFKSSFPIAIRRRLERAFEWFRLANTETHQVTDPSKVVMMATAFEILLDVPNQPNKKSWMADRMDELCGASDSVRVTRTVGTKSISHTQTAWWMWDFYDLRNAIVHGDAVLPARFGYPTQGHEWLAQLIVADLVLWELVVRMLYEHRCLGHDIRELAQMWDGSGTPDPSDRAEPALCAWFLGFGEVHRALGWRPGLPMQTPEPCGSEANG